MRIHAVEESAPYEGAADVSCRAADKDVGDVADVLLHVYSQVFKGGAQDGDAHSLETQT